MKNIKNVIKKFLMNWINYVCVIMVIVFKNILEKHVQRA